MLLSWSWLFFPHIIRTQHATIPPTHLFTFKLWSGKRDCCAGSRCHRETGTIHECWWCLTSPSNMHFLQNRYTINTGRHASTWTTNQDSADQLLHKQEPKEFDSRCVEVIPYKWWKHEGIVDNAAASQQEGWWFKSPSRLVLSCVWSARSALAFVHFL